ncbi:hypothetical protein BDQ17DRAFT_1241222 [Cyathus striatus]|nr:hypothetical protein BDQ17DRAFT_1241222 [Cyathus striatus]
MSPDSPSSLGKGKEKGPERRFTESPTQSSDGEESSEGEESLDEEEGEEGEEGENNEDNEDEEEDEGSSSEEEDEDEPALKYSRITNSLPDLLKKDSASALAIANNTMALGTHAGIIHILTLDGTRIKSYKPHLASILDITIDPTGDFVGSASIDGQIHIRSLSLPESYTFDHKRPLRTLSLEPNFSKRSTRGVIYGGLSGSLILREKGWLGHKETILHSGEGPIWTVRWKGRLIAWANDLGVKIYDTHSQSRITYIDRPPSSPRADLYKCTLHWQDSSTLLIAWANYIKVARIRDRPRDPTNSTTAGLPPLLVEITACFELDAMVAGLVPHPLRFFQSYNCAHTPGALRKTKYDSDFTVTSYIHPPEPLGNLDEPTDDRTLQARKLAERPELRIVSRAGEELAADALSVSEFQKFGCNDYILVPAFPDDDEGGEGEDRRYVVLSPRDLVLVQPRDRRDHIVWLVERERYEEALEEVEEKEGEGDLTVRAIGQKYIAHLVKKGEYAQAARLTPKACGVDAHRWEDWIFLFADRKELQAIIPYVPTDNPQLDHVVYEMILAHFLSHDRQTLLKTIKEWPREIYDITAVIFAVRAELDKVAGSSRTLAGSGAGVGENVLLMECLAELYTANRQPGKALPYFLRLRRPNVFDLIKDNNLFTDVTDQVLLLVEFDHELMQKRKAEGGGKGGKSEAIQLLVDHLHSIPMTKVVAQLERRPYYLFLYLDELVQKDANLVAPYANVLVKLYAEFATPRLIDFLRVSSDYHLDFAYKVCKERDLVLETVFILGRMGNNKEALTVIIERLGDVHRAIEFAKEQNDDELWEDLLKYSETRPTFIRGLLENVGVEISPVRLIRRIKNGLEIPGLKEALIKILQDFHLQISLLEGCQAILNGDSSEFGRRLQKGQGSGFFLTGKTACPICTRPLQDNPQSLIFLYLCRHVVHAGCVTVTEGETLPPPPDPILRSVSGSGRGISGSIAYESMIRGRLRHGCPVCFKHSQGLVVR